MTVEDDPNAYRSDYSCMECDGRHEFPMTETEKHADLFADREPTPTSELHIHFLYVKGRWNWVLRGGRSPLCKTRRCRRVYLVEVEEV